MTSFLALRASVCVVIPSVMCYGYGPPVPRHRSTNIYSAENGRWHLDGRVASALRFEFGELTLIFFSHLSGLNFALMPPTYSNSSSRAGARCVGRFSSREFSPGETIKNNKEKC